MKKELSIDNEIFKKIKKHKKVIYVQLNDEKLEEKRKVIVTNKDNNKKIKRKIKKIYSATNLEELKSILNKKEKYILPKNIEDIYSKEDILKNGIVGIEFKRNKKIFRKIFLGIIVVVLLYLLFNFVTNLIEDDKVNKLKDNLEEIKEKEINYVIVEINPKAILEVVNDKVVSKGCLNEDCKTIFNNIDINKTLKETIEAMYNVAKEKGIDVSNGVKVSSSNTKIENKVKELEYVEYTNITTSDEKGYLEQVLDNEELKNETSKEDRRL